MFNIPERFRFLNNRRLRQQAATQRERDHQLALVRELVRALEVLADGQTRQAEEQSKALMELAHASTANASAFGEWIKSFQAVAPPTTSNNVVENDDVSSLRDSLGIDELPEEFRLAFQLQTQNDFLADVRKDIRP